MDDRQRQDEEPLTPTQRRSNVFSDEYEVVDVDVSDGFRRPSTSHSDDEHIYSAAAHYAANPVMSFSPEPEQQTRRNSTRKSRSYDNPFASAQDTGASISRTPSIASTSQYAPGLARRSISGASTHQYAGTNSPRIGVAGPSHPYTMYPQGTMIRSPSAATSVQNRRQSSLRGGPAHPYSAYPQGVVDSDDDDEETALNPVPVGFGLVQTYRRVRGPEGEEQDIIGEYGHAEQLPPYSRYPEEGPEKAPLLAIPEGLHTRAPVEGTDPGMPLMHQQISRQSRQSMTDASNLESAPLMGSDASETGTMTSASSISEKSWKQKNWKERRATPICGVPFGWILIALCVCGFAFAVLVGSLVGYLAGKKDRGTTPPQAVVVTTSLYDASIIATPTNAPASGTFALTLSTPQATQADCLVNSNQRVAWDCSLVGRPAVAMTVGLPAQASPTQGARIYYAAENTNLSYGAQISELQSQWSTLIPVVDNDDPSLGPAFFFQSTYDKVVVLPQNVFTPSKVKRDAYAEPNWDAYKNRKATKAQPGERPWFCFFNNTAIEGFIYVQKPAAMYNFSATTTTASSASITPAPSSPYSAAYSGTNPQAAWQSYRSVAEAAKSSYIAGLQARDNVHWDDNTWSAMYKYPYLVKVEERRLPNNTVAAYCQQYQVLENGQYNAYTENGKQLKLFLEERDPPGPVYSGTAKRATMQGGCHCQWMHGLPP